MNTLASTPSENGPGRLTFPRADLIAIAEQFHRAVEIAAKFGSVTPWSRMAGGAYHLMDVASALAAVAE